VRIASRERLWPLLGLGLLVAVLPGMLVAAVGYDQADFSGLFHFLGVGFTASVTAAAALGLTVVGARNADTRTVLVGGAFAVMAALLALHGLSTPGVLVGQNGVISLTGGVTLPVGGALLALSVAPLPGPLRRVDVLLKMLGLLLAGVILIGVSAIAFPALVPSVPQEGSTGALALLAAGLACYAIVALRALRTFLLTRRRGDLAVMVGLVWLGTALVPALTMGWYDLGWWMGHELELDGIFVVGIAVALDLACPYPSRPLAGDLHAAELVAAEELFLGSHVRALTRRLAEKDAYTEQHTRRVALLAVEVGERLGLSRSRLRALAVGALVHDIGKLSIPEAVLKKPSALSDEEYALVQTHAERGAELLANLGGFPAAVCGLVRDHHERLDGRGYPRGLQGDELALDTRILTVCDVYDALISTRVYRPPWTREQAIGLLSDQVGAAFDPRCISALELATSEQPPQAAPAPEPARPGLARREWLLTR